MFKDYKDVVTVKELAEMLRIGRNSAYDLIRTGEIPCVKVGRKIRIPKDMVKKYVLKMKR